MINRGGFRIEKQKAIIHLLMEILLALYRYKPFQLSRAEDEINHEIAKAVIMATGH